MDKDVNNMLIEQSSKRESALTFEEWNMAELHEQVSTMMMMMMMIAFKCKHICKYLACDKFSDISYL